MPTYEYECQTCHERLEAVQKFADPALTTCPACGGELRKVFSAVGIVFKGSGFYKNDSRASGTKTTTPAGGSSTSAESSSSSPPESNAASSSSSTPESSGSTTSSTKTESVAKPASSPKSPSSKKD